MTAFEFGRPNVLLALGNEQAASSLADVLLRKQFGVFAAKDNRDAVQKMQASIYNVLVIDEKFPELGGLDFCRFIRLTVTPMAVAPIVFGLHEPNQQSVIAARDAGATKIAVMPFSGATLIKAIEAAAADPRPIVQHTSYNGPDRRTRVGRPPGSVDRRRQQSAKISRIQQIKILKGN